MLCCHFTLVFDAKTGLDNDAFSRLHHRRNRVLPISASEIEPEFASNSGNRGPL